MGPRRRVVASVLQRDPEVKGHRSPARQARDGPVASPLSSHPARVSAGVSRTRKYHELTAIVGPPSRGGPPRGPEDLAEVPLGSRHLPPAAGEEDRQGMVAGLVRLGKDTGTFKGPSRTLNVPIAALCPHRSLSPSSCVPPLSDF